MASIPVLRLPISATAFSSGPSAGRNVDPFSSQLLSCAVGVQAQTHDFPPLLIRSRFSALDAPLGRDGSEQVMVGCFTLLFLVPSQGFGYFVQVGFRFVVLPL